jgi:phytoene desaturase
MKKKTIIIGSGFGGLCLGCRLAARGYDVEIFEKRDQPGGCASTFEINGFKFDTGPAVLHVPEMFDDIFELAGKKREDYVTFIPLDPFYRVFDASKKAFNYNSDINATLEQIALWDVKDKKGYRHFLNASRSALESSLNKLAEKPFLHFTDLLKTAPDLIKWQYYLSDFQYVSQFFRNEFLRRAFSFHPLLLGSNPFEVQSPYCMLQSLEREAGVQYTCGGSGELVRALVRLFEELGGTIHLNAEVKQIISEWRRVTGIRLADGSTRQADFIISNADVANTYRRMIDPRYRRHNNNRRFEQYKYSPSFFVIYFGTRRRYLDSGLAHHNIIFGPRYRDLIYSIFNRKALSEDFWLYLHMPTYSDESIAPPESESFCVLSPVPNLSSPIDWANLARPYRDRIMQFLEENYLPDLRANIIAERYIDPPYFQNTLNYYQGAAFSIQSGLNQSGWFRPHNRSEDFQNLYFVGAGTHPGPGLPGVLNSAIIVERLIAESQ